MKRLSILLCLSLLCAVPGCNDNPTGSSFDPLSLTPREDVTAELMAMYVSNELTAPSRLYRQIHSDLDLIDQKYGAQIEQWDDSANFDWSSIEAVRFSPHWVVSRVIISVDSAAHNLMATGEHEGLNAVLEKLHGTWRKGIRFPQNPNVWYDKVNFEGRLNSKRACQYFIGLDGISAVESAGIGGGSSIIMPVFTRNARSYCYQMSWGDCLAGCAYSKWYYFRIEDGEAIFVDSTRRGVQPSPAWADTVRQRTSEWQQDGFSWHR